MLRPSAYAWRSHAGTGADHADSGRHFPSNAGLAGVQLRPWSEVIEQTGM
jgi:hypothetical protein